MEDPCYQGGDSQEISQGLPNNYRPATSTCNQPLNLPVTPIGYNSTNEFIRLLYQPCDQSSNYYQEEGSLPNTHKSSMQPAYQHINHQGTSFGQYSTTEPHTYLVQPYSQTNDYHTKEGNLSNVPKSNMHPFYQQINNPGASFGPTSIVEYPTSLHQPPTHEYMKLKPLPQAPQINSPNLSALQNEQGLIEQQKDSLISTSGIRAKSKVPQLQTCQRVIMNNAIIPLPNDKIDEIKKRRKVLKRRMNTENRKTRKYEMLRKIKEERDHYKEGLYALQDILSKLQSVILKRL